MKNQSQAGAKRPAKTLDNQSAKPGAVPNEPEAPEPHLIRCPTVNEARQQYWDGENWHPYQTIVDHDDKSLLMGANGAVYLYENERQYFDGKKWQPVRRCSNLKARGICSDPLLRDEPRLRIKRVAKLLTGEEAHAWILSNYVPIELQSSFAAPLAGEYSAMPKVEVAAHSMGITSDAFVCHAVEVFLQYIAERPDEAAKFRAIEVVDVDYIEGRKSYPTEPARALVSRLYNEAKTASFLKGQDQLLALRDLIAPHPGFASECEAISKMLEASVDLEEIYYDPKATAAT